jgi:outer membrane protein assembly factor BamB
MRSAKRTAGVLAGCVLLLGAGGLWAGDWPQWRGPNRDAHATDFKAPATWPKELTRKWRETVGDGVATPALVGDKLYVFTRQGGDEILRCLDAATGKEIWLDKYATEGVRGPDQSFPGPRCSPTVADGKVVTLGVNGVLSCLDADKGKVLWRKEDVKGYPRFHTSSSPIVVDGLCIAQMGGGSNGGIVAYDLASGEQKWKAPTDSPAYASPELLTVDGTKLVATLTETKVVAVNVADGKVAWEAPFRIEGRGYNAATPIVDGQTLIYTGSGRGVKAVRFEKEGDRITAKPLWSNPDKSVMFNTPVLKAGFLYGITADNQLFCINAQTGKTAWSAPVGAGPPAAKGAEKGGEKGGGGRGMRGGGGGGYGSVVDAGSVLLALTPGMQLIAFQPTDKGYTEQARIKVADSATYAYPVVSGNRIYIKDREAVTLWTID